MNSVFAFKAALIQPAMTLMSYPTHPLWQTLSQNVNQDILNDAYSQMLYTEHLFAELGEMTPRKVKYQERIVKKMQQVEGRDQQYSKVVSDFIAFRVNCKVTEIDDKIKTISNVVSKYYGSMWLKGNFRSGSGKYLDIVQYVYVYIPQVGYITEFQIGSSFASYTFYVDSRLRDDPEYKHPDLWTDKTYETVKHYILNQANNTLHNCTSEEIRTINCKQCEYYPSKYDAWDKVFRLFPTGDVPVALRKALDEMENKLDSLSQPRSSKD